MSRSLSYETSYDVPPHEAFRIRNRLDYLEAKADALDQLEFKVLELRQRDGRFRCVTTMRMDVHLPGWARTLFHSRNTITQYELWHDPWADGTRVCDIVATVTNVPVSIRGQGLVSPVGTGGCRYHLDLEVSSRAPVVGKRLETFVAEQLDRTATGELEFGARWLAQRV